MNKIICLLLTLLLSLAVCTSCKIGGDTGAPDAGGSGSSSGGSSDTGNGGSGNTDSGSKQSYIYNESSTLTVIYAEDSISEENAVKLGAALREALGNRYTVVNDPSTPASEHELVIGHTDREITRKAYKKLSRQYKETATETAYAIYSDGKSLAIVFDEALYGYAAAECTAIDYLTGTLLKDKTLSLGVGTVSAGTLDVIEWQKSFDDIATEARWAEIEEQLVKKYGEEIAADTVYALKGLYSLYGDEVASWIANLYDPETGGFYYSNSARDTVGFLPDLESTYQLLGLPASLGMTGDLGKDYASFYPERMQATLVEWIRGLQDPTNGYFYHPQWGKAFTDQILSRRGRDLQWAEGLLKYFNASPIYDTPGGMKGVGSVSGVAHRLASPLGGSSVSAVASVLSVNSDAGVSKHLLNDVNFKEYLETLDINGNSYSVGNTLESQATQIVNRDRTLASRGVHYRLSDILEEWLNSHQNPSTGLWTLDGSKDGSAINGLLKISSTYNKIGKEIPHIKKAMMAAVEYTIDDEEPVHICYVLNPLYAVSILRTNIYSCNKSLSFVEREELISELDLYVMENALSIVSTTTARLAVFRKDDGSFSYYPKQTASSSQGAPVAVNGTNEGDANSTNIGAVAIPGHLFSMLGIGDIVRICSEADGIRFLLTLESLDPVIKNVEEDEREFANGDYVRKYGGAFYSGTDTGKINSLYRATTAIGANGLVESPRCEYIKLVTDETLDTGVLEYGKSTVESTQGFVVRRTGQQAAGNCFVFETDFRINELSEHAAESIPTGEVPFLIDLTIGIFDTATSARAVSCEYIGKIGSILLSADGGKLSTALSHATKGYQYALYSENGYSGAWTKAGEWVTYTVELYDNGIAKYYINNVCVEEAQIFDSTEAFFTEADVVRVCLNSKSTSSSVWFDNTLVGTVNKEYKKSKKHIDYSDFTLKAGNYAEILGSNSFNANSAQHLQQLGYVTRATTWTSTAMPTTDWSTMHREYVNLVELERDGKLNKALEFGELITNSYGIYLRRSGEGTGRAFVFEADFLLEIDSESAARMAKSSVAEIMKMYVGSSEQTTSVGGTDIFYQGSEIARIYAKKDGEGNMHYYFNRPLLAASKACTDSAEISVGWNALTVEMFDNGIAKYYVNGKYLGESDLLTDADRESLKTLNSVKLCFADAIDYSSVFIDNMLLSNVDIEYEKYIPNTPPPTGTDSENSPFDSGGNVGDGDWTK